MAAPMEDVKNAVFDSKTNSCRIEVTVPTGFEQVAGGEVKEKIGSGFKELRGKISFECPIESVEKVTKLRTVDNCRVVMLYQSNYEFSDDKVENMQKLRDLVASVNWPLGIQVWKRFFSFEHPIAEVPEEITSDFGEPYFPPPRQNSNPEKKSKRSKGKKWKKKRENLVDKAKDEPVEAISGSGAASQESGDKTETVTKSVCDLNNSVNVTNGSECPKTNETAQVTEGGENPNKKPRVRENPWNPLMPSFRVTCNRSGDKHNFDSMTAAANFGGAIYQYFGWNIKMTEFDMEVILAIDDHEVTVSMGLTKESLHRRDITSFGPTTLRPTVANGMLRLCSIQSGDIVCDPMCGSGSIPIQCSLGWPLSYNLAGEIGKRALDRVRDNLSFVAQQKMENKSLPVDSIRWDVCNLPLRDNSVDVFITDLPFGVRMGHKVDNWRLYPGALLEMARVVSPNTGRCCLLTEDKKCMIKTIQKMGKYWTRTKTLGINLGGLAAGVFVLARTAEGVNKGDNPSMYSARGTKGDNMDMDVGSDKGE
ncbi:tRNA (guanine(6)-N2)-methyltransferase THUMP3-like [Mya arenaria]|uniref:tRNA (guanine(6)-N2)-methyltransferase THUMP3-like n=1 Tax=Mya arenaria TaxID=6604 RepID=UPI0022E46E9C|nr:tRNA (guanine(6)-N2)-methyltransferase THUMP3-like [Mya arenaria]